MFSGADTEGNNCDIYALWTQVKSNIQNWNSGIHDKDNRVISKLYMQQKAVIIMEKEMYINAYSEMLFKEALENYR